MIQLTNHGALITATDYWRSDLARAGKMIVSPNAGSIRCLVPPQLAPVLGELRSAEYAICSVGPWPAANAEQAVEILWEDHTDSPHAWHLTAESCVLIPGDPAPSHWTISCWVERRGEPHRVIERPCHWRRVASLPCLRPIRQSSP